MHVKVVVTVGGESGAATISIDGDVEERKGQGAFLYDVHQMIEKLVQSPEGDKK